MVNAKTDFFLFQGVFFSKGFNFLTWSRGSTKGVLFKILEITNPLAIDFSTDNDFLSKFYVKLYIKTIEKKNPTTFMKSEL